MTYKIRDGHDWTLWRSPAVENESTEMIAQIGRSFRLFKKTFSGLDSSLKNDGLTLGALPDIFNVQDQHKEDLEHLNTETDFSGYRFYNLFALTSPSPLFWLLFKDCLLYTSPSPRD